MKSNGDYVFNTDKDLQAEQFADLERCWDEYSTYPDGPVKSGWKDHPGEERQIHVTSTDSGYTKDYTSHFIYGDKWNTYYFARNALVDSSLIAAFAWLLISSVCFVVVNTKYAKPKETTHDKVI
jgi:hypothetical protein